MLRGVRVLAGESVLRVRRESGVVVVESEAADGATRREAFDRVVTACDAPTALAMLGESVGQLTRFLLRRIVSCRAGFTATKTFCRPRARSGCAKCPTA